jgi:hypothetical protein
MKLYFACNKEQMKSYFALSYSPLHELKIWTPENLPTVLSSYWILRGINEERVQSDFCDRDCFLDSGAFTAFTKQVDIDIDEYIDFIKRTKKVWDTYAVLDVIGDYKATEKNQKYMESKGLKPLPTFHYGSPLEELKRLVKEYDYIALGGLVPLALHRKKLQNWLDRCFSIIKTDCKIHGFGVNSIWAWERYPFYSVDATSWNQGMKFGRVIESSGIRQKVIKGDMAIYLNKGKGWQHRTRMNIDAYNELAKNITKLWESRGVKWDQ